MKAIDQLRFMTTIKGAAAISRENKAFRCNLAVLGVEVCILNWSYPSTIIWRLLLIIFGLRKQVEERGSKLTLHVYAFIEAESKEESEKKTAVRRSQTLAEKAQKNATAVELCLRILGFLLAQCSVFRKSQTT